MPIPFRKSVRASRMKKMRPAKTRVRSSSTIGRKRPAERVPDRGLRAPVKTSARKASKKTGTEVASDRGLKRLQRKDERILELKNTINTLKTVGREGWRKHASEIKRLIKRVDEEGQIRLKLESRIRELEKPGRQVEEE